MNASSPDQPYSISIRNKLILSVTLVHLVLMGFFVGDTFFRQREFLLHEDRSSALNFASLAAGDSPRSGNDEIREVAGIPIVRPEVGGRNGDHLRKSRDLRRRRNRSLLRKL